MVSVFIGTHKSDLVLYVASFLKHLGKRILIVDNTRSLEIVSNLYIPKSLDPNKGLVESYGLFFIQNKKMENLNGVDSFDCIFICYDHNFVESQLPKHDNLIVVTDVNRNTMYNLFKTGVQVCDYLVIRNVVGIGNQHYEAIAEKLNPSKGVTLLELSDLDLKREFQNQNSNVLKFNRISVGLKNAVIEIVGLHTPTTFKELTKIYKRM